jgi:exopolysaccharide production protein ExoQ
MSPPSGLSRIAGAGFAVLAFLMPVVSVFASKGLAVLFILAGLAALLECVGRAVRRPSNAMLWLIGAILAWSGLTTLWALNWQTSLKEFGVLLVGTVAGLLILSAVRAMDAEYRRLVEKSLVAGFLVGLVLLAEELVTGGWLISHLYRPWDSYFFNQGAVTLALLLWPVLIILVRAGRQWAGLLLFCVVVGVLCLSSSGAAIVGCFGAAAAAAVMTWRSKVALVVAQVAVASGILMAPLIVRALPTPETMMEHYTSAMDSAMPRVVIWNYVVDRIEERPLLGWGLDSSRLFSSKKDEGVLDPVWTIISEPLPLHPHNAILQWWLELGIVGAALFTLLLLALVRGIARFRTDPVTKALALGQFTSAIVIAAVSYGIWQGWWLGALWLSAAFTVMLLSESRPAE